MMALLNNLSIRSRLLLSLALFILTLGLASKNAYDSIGANVLFAEQEIKGNLYQRPVAGMLLASALLRLEIAQSSPDANSIKKHLSAVEALWPPLLAAQESVGKDLQFTEEGQKSRGRESLALDQVQSKWKAITEAPDGITDEKLASFIADLRGLIAHSGDTSNLILDPDLDSYYLMDVTLLALPQTLDRLSAIGATLAPKLGTAGSSLSSADATEAAVMARMLKESDIGRVVADMDVSLKEDANFYGLDQTYQEAHKAFLTSYNEDNGRLVETLEKAARNEAMTQKDFTADNQKAIEAAHKFLAYGYDALDKLLLTRIESYKAQQRQSLMISFAGAFASLLFFLVVVRTITRPLRALTGTMHELTNNNLSIAVPFATAKSEIGEMAHSINIFKENALRMEGMKQEQIALQEKAEADKKQALHELASMFETSVGGIVEAVASAGTELRANAEGLAHISNETSEQSSHVVMASNIATGSIQTVASSAEELSASIGEISRLVNDSSEKAQNAVGHVRKANETVKSLSTSSTEIGQVVQLINDIAAQTNLLALNATIEAARAGEAGKGFAVVAGEVKSLAGQTAKATEEISARIAGIQAVSNDAIQVIEAIGAIVASISDATTNIASAVTQQSAATHEIAKNAQEVAMGTKDVTESIEHVTNAAKESRHSSEEVLDAAKELSEQSERLKSEVFSFLDRVKSA